MKIPKFESLIIFIFLACVALWGMSKCSDRKSGDLSKRLKPDDTEEEVEERPAARRDTTRRSASTPDPAPLPTPAPPAATPLAPKPGSNNSSSAIAPKPAASAPKPAAETPTASKLYVTIDGLKLRKQPGLKSDVITELSLYEQVTFLNQKSTEPVEISIGYEKVTDYWVKVRTQSGKEGWAFGAGLHYYKMKRKGTIE